MLNTNCLKPEDRDTLFISNQESFYSFKDCFIHPSYLNIPPQDSIGIKTCLEYLQLIYESMLKALFAFNRLELSKFDALVGNNSCFLTSYHVHMIAIRFSNDEKFKDKLEEVLKKLIQLKNHPVFIEHDKIFQNIKNFEEFLEKQDLLLDCDPSFFYLTICYILCLAKDKDPNEVEKISYEKIHLFFSSLLNKSISSKLVSKLIKHLQRQVTYLGVDSLYQDVKKLESNCAWKKYIYPPFAVFDERKRICTPSLYTQKVTFELLKMSPGTLVCLEVHIIEKPKKFKQTFRVFYKVKNGNFIQVEESELEYKSPVLMYAGCRYVDQYKDINLEEIRMSFKVKNLEEMLFSHEVTYPQYSKALHLKDIIPDEIELQNELLQLKKNRGFSLEDPSFLCFAHIYPSSVLEIQTELASLPVYLPSL